MDLARYVPLFGKTETTRFAYLRLPLLQEALTDDRVLTALLDVLAVPGKPAVLRALGHDEKLAAIQRQIEHYQESKTSLWRDVPLPDVLAASLFRSELPNKIVLKLFADVKKESALCAPVGEWFRSKRFVVVEEVPLGTCRADVLAIREGGWLTSTESAAIELKNDRAELRGGLDQMTTYREYVHRVYLACTPSLAMAYLLHHAEASKVKHFDSQLLDRRLKELGLGLLLVEGDAVFECIEPQAREPQARKWEEVTLALGDIKRRRAAR